MGSVIVMHRGVGVLAAGVSALIEAGHHVREVSTREEVLASLARAQSDLVVCETAPVECTGPDGLMQALRRAAPRASLLLLVGEDDSVVDARAEAELSTPGVMRPPFTRDGVLAAALSALGGPTARTGKGFLGSVVGLQLVEILQMFHFARRTATVLFEAAVPGRIEFDRGQVVHAECGAHRGAEAFQLLLAAPGGRFRVTTQTSDVRTIDRPFDILLMSSLQALDPVTEPRSETLGSWFPLADEALTDIAAIPAMAPLPRAIVPECLPVTEPPPVVEAEPASVARWRIARAQLGARAAQTIVVAVHRVTRTVSVLQGAVDIAGLGDAVTVLEAQLARLARGAANGVCEYYAGRVAAALLWNRDDDYALLLADLLPEGGVAGFRLHVAAIARCVSAAGTESARKATGT